MFVLAEEKGKEENEDPDPTVLEPVKLLNSDLVVSVATRNSH